LGDEQGQIRQRSIIVAPELIAAMPVKISTINARYLQLLIAWGGGLLAGLAVEPIGAWYLAWIALIPLWMMVVRDKRCTLPSLAWGIGYHGVALFWITGIHPMAWMGVPWSMSLAIAIVCLTFITLWGAALVTIWGTACGWLFAKFQLPTLARVLVGTAIWCGLEYVWSQGDLWWSTLALTQSPGNLPILHLGQLTGGSAVTAALIVANGLIAEAIMARPIERQKLTMITTGLALVVYLTGFYLSQSNLDTNPQNALRIGLIQGNIPNEIKLYPQGLKEAQEGYTKGYRELAAAGAEAVLTPEVALPLMPAEIKTSSIYQAVLEKRVPLWLGAFDSVNKDYTNSLHSIDHRGNFISRYDKSKLVPLGEYVPFKEFIGQWVKRLSPLEASLHRGQANQEFLAWPGIKAATGICYESAFGEHFRQQAKHGEFIITASNNAHYAASMPAQHHAQDVMRAIETSRWAVRATNTGYSAIVDPHGYTLWKSKLNEFATHTHQIYRRTNLTPYIKWGDWLTPLLLVTAGVTLWLFRGKEAKNSMK
jgi:apolipoprotein N-acyltransferase